MILINDIHINSMTLQCTVKIPDILFIADPTVSRSLRDIKGPAILHIIDQCNLRRSFCSYHIIQVIQYLSQGSGLFVDPGIITTCVVDQCTVKLLP